MGCWRVGITTVSLFQVTINEEFVNKEQQASEEEQRQPNAEQQAEEDSGEQSEDRVPPPSASPKSAPGAEQPAPAAAPAAAAAHETPKSPAPADRAAPEEPRAPGQMTARCSTAASATASLQKLLPQMEAVSRVLSIPVVESGVGLVADVYSRVKVTLFLRPLFDEK